MEGKLKYINKNLDELVLKRYKDDLELLTTVFYTFQNLTIRLTWRFKNDNIHLLKVDEFIFNK